MKDVQFGIFPDLKCGQAVFSVAMNKAGTILACGLEYGEVHIWDLSVCTRKAVIAAHKKRVTGICFSNDE